jgi:hypothetical protein
MSSDAVVDSSYQCPFCKNAYVGRQAACPHCHRKFQWNENYEETWKHITERETNRARATATAIQELYDATKEKRPVSLSAIKGLVFAWLFPRTVIVIGSIIAGLVLIAQTIILYSQKQIMQLQLRSTLVEESRTIRARVKATLVLRKDLQGFQTIYANLPSAFKCEDEECAKTVALDALRRIDPRKDDKQGDVGRRLYDPIFAAMDGNHAARLLNTLYEATLECNFAPSPESLSALDTLSKWGEGISVYTEPNRVRLLEETLRHSPKSLNSGTANMRDLSIAMERVLVPIAKGLNDASRACASVLDAARSEVAKVDRYFPMPR